MSTTPLIKAVCKAMERIAPLRLAEKWDNVGLLLESPLQKPHRNRILLTIDLTPSVLAESLSTQASVIVSYHPPIFKGLQSLTLANPLQTSLLRCAAEGISVYSPHTALDSVWGGVNDWLAEGVLSGRVNGEIRALVEEKLGISGESEGGEGRLVTMNNPISMDELQSRIKKHLKVSQVQVGYATGVHDHTTQPIRTVAICAGSGGSMLLGKHADVYFTGEMSHHEVLAAVASGKHVILCGHTNTERGYLPILASKLRHELQAEGLQSTDGSIAEVEVIVSHNDQHPLQFV